MSDIKGIQVIESGSQNDHSDTSRAAEQFEAKNYALPSICVDDIPLSDIDKFIDPEANDSDVTEKVHTPLLEQHTRRQHLGKLPVYDSGLSFDSVVSNDAYQEDVPLD